MRIEVVVTKSKDVGMTFRELMKTSKTRRLALLVTVKTCQLFFLFFKYGIFMQTFVATGMRPGS